MMAALLMLRLTRRLLLAAVASLLAVAGAAPAVSTPAPAAETRGRQCHLASTPAVNAARLAFVGYQNITKTADCGKGTLFFGIMAYYNASADLAALASTRAYAERNRYRLCGSTLPEAAASSSDFRPFGGRVAAPPVGDASLCSAGMYQEGVSYFGAAASASNHSAASAAACCSLCKSHHCSFFTFRAASKSCFLAGAESVPVQVVREGGASSGWPSSSALGPYGDRGGWWNASGPHNPNNQLCAAVYCELFFLEGNTSYLADSRAVFDEEIIAEPAGRSWSWIDATYMTMNTLPRLAVASGEPK
jgi:hypothetical protein